MGFLASLFKCSVNRPPNAALVPSSAVRWALSADSVVNNSLGKCMGNADRFLNEDLRAVILRARVGEGAESSGNATVRADPSGREADKDGSHE